MTSLSTDKPTRTPGLGKVTTDAARKILLDSFASLDLRGYSRRITKICADKPAKLLKIPPELRNQIYEYVYHVPEESLRVLDVSAPNKDAIRLCKQIYSEMKELQAAAYRKYWTGNVFELPMRMSGLKPFGYIGADMEPPREREVPDEAGLIRLGADIQGIREREFPGEAHLIREKDIGHIEHFQLNMPFYKFHIRFTGGDWALEVEEVCEGPLVPHTYAGIPYQRIRDLAEESVRRKLKGCKDPIKGGGLTASQVSSLADLRDWR